MRLKQVHTIADRQFGLITRDGLHSCGLSDKEIEHLVRTKSILRVHRAVYRTPGSRASIEQKALAATLAAGENAVASHMTAAALWGIVEPTGGLPEVSVPRSRRSELSTLIAHRPRSLPRDEVTRLGIIPVTRVARTLADISGRLQRDDFEDAVDDPLRRRIVTLDQLDRYPSLRTLAEDRRDGIPGSRLERRAINALCDAGLPKPVRQHKVRLRGHNYEIDLAYPDRMVAIELEGDAPHWGRTRRQYDFDRRNALELAGWRVYPYTWADTTELSLYFVTRVGERSGLRPTRWSAR